MRREELYLADIVEAADADLFSAGTAPSSLLISTCVVHWCFSGRRRRAGPARRLRGLAGGAGSPRAHQPLPPQPHRLAQEEMGQVEKMDDLFHQLTAALRSIPPPPAIERPTARTRALQSTKTGQVGLTHPLR